MSTDTHLLTGVYALDALEDAERREFEEHVAGCAECAEEVAGLRATAAMIGTASAGRPSAALRAQVMARIAQTRQEPPARPVVPFPEPEPLAVPDELAARRSRRGARLAIAGVAASLVAAAALGVTAVQLKNDLDRSRSELSASAGQLQQEQAHAQAVAAVVTAPDATTTTGGLTGGGGHGTAVVSRSLSKAVFVAQGMPGLPSTETYQLWLIGTDGPRSAGIMNAGQATSPQVVTDLANADKIGVTVEPAGGSKAPTSVPIMLFGLDA